MGQTMEKMVSLFQQENLGVLYAQMRQGGKVTGEFTKTPKKARMNLYSVSKSVVSVGAGIAMEEGIICLDEKICDAFPEYVPEDASSNLLDLQVKHLLTMTTGLENALFFADSPERYSVKDWVDYFFHAKFTRKPGEQFLYSNFNTYMLSCLIERRAGQNLLEYLRYRLFEPIGVGNPDWTLCPKGHAHAANGLYFNIDELGNFGQLLLQEGAYNGKQIVSADYLREATADRVKCTGVRKDDALFYGYGYQFWRTRLENTFMCDGNYGQYCLVIPEKECVISILSFEANYGRIKEILLDCAEEMIIGQK